VIQKLRHRFDARDEQVISCPRAGNIEQVARSVIDLLQVRLLPCVGKEGNNDSP
jgi:hypothetical protein